MKTRIILLLLLLVMAAAGFKCGKTAVEQCGGTEDGCWQGSFHTKQSGTSPKGIRIASYNAVPSVSQLALYDKGLDNLFDISRRVYGYTQMLDQPNYQFFVHPTSNKCQTPGFVIPVQGLALWPDGWDNHPDYDKDPRVGYSLLCAAGMMFGVDGAVLADSPQIAENIARFEGEHLVLYNNDRPKFDSTVFVHYHPILPDTDGSLIGGPKWTAGGLTLPRSVEMPDGLLIEKGTKICVIFTK